MARISTAKTVSSRSLPLVLVLLVTTLRRSAAWSGARNVPFAAPPRAETDGTFAPPDCTGISEELCIDTARRMQRVNVPVSTTIHPQGSVGISYVHWPAATATSAPTTRYPKIILVHGFDSSALEFRRLGSRLAERGLDTYAVDLWGWGFTRFQSSDNESTTTIDYSAAAKVEALQSWISTVVLSAGHAEGFVIAGASLGGAAAIETAVRNMNEACRGLVLIDAQGFVDGVGPMSMLPPVLARWGVDLLQSVPLRSSANQMSYANKDVYATDEAVVVGRLHTLRPGWNTAMVNFMKSGGFAPSLLVPQIAVPTLVLWGRQDTILDGATLAPKFVQTITAAPTTLQWVENCGHVPHLEQPEYVCVYRVPVCCGVNMEHV
jgi:pimeloyl-ACP methyl ester carboxylesterase